MRSTDSTGYAQKGIHMTQQSTSGQDQVFTDSCRQEMESGSRIRMQSGSSFLNANVQSLTTGGTIAARSGIAKLASTANRVFTLARPSGPGVDLTIIAKTTFVQKVKASSSGILFGSTNSLNDTITFDTTAAAVMQDYGMSIRLFSESTRLWSVISDSTVKATFSTST